MASAFRTAGRKIVAYVNVLSSALNHPAVQGCAFLDLTSRKETDLIGSTQSDAPSCGNAQCITLFCVTTGPFDENFWICGTSIGRNYADHAKELGNAVPKEPFFFLKPTSSYVDSPGTIEIPKGVKAHYEGMSVFPPAFTPIFFKDPISGGWEAAVCDTSTSTSARPLVPTLQYARRKCHFKRRGVRTCADLIWCIVRALTGEQSSSALLSAKMGVIFPLVKQWSTWAGTRWQWT